jgi:hypothetical protein
MQAGEETAIETARRTPNTPRPSFDQTVLEFPALAEAEASFGNGASHTTEEKDSAERDAKASPSAVERPPSIPPQASSNTTRTPDESHFFRIGELGTYEGGPNSLPPKTPVDEWVESAPALPPLSKAQRERRDRNRRRIAIGMGVLAALLVVGIAKSMLSGDTRPADASSRAPMPATPKAEAAHTESPVATLPAVPAVVQAEVVDEEAVDVEALGEEPSADELLDEAAEAEPQAEEKASQSSRDSDPGKARPEQRSSVSTDRTETRTSTTKPAIKATTRNSAASTPTPPKAGPEPASPQASEKTGPVPTYAFPPLE